jgi:hypothetical protein
VDTVSLGNRAVDDQVERQRGTPEHGQRMRLRLREECRRLVGASPAAAELAEPGKRFGTAAACEAASSLAADVSSASAIFQTPRERQIPAYSVRQTANSGRIRQRAENSLSRSHRWALRALEPAVRHGGVSPKGPIVPVQQQRDACG